MSSLRLEAVRRWWPSSRGADWPEAAPDGDRAVHVSAVRTGALIVVGVATASLLLQAGLTTFAGTGPIGTRLPQLLVRFPVEAVLLVIAAGLLVARDPRARGPWRDALLHAALLGAAVSGVVYAVALRSEPVPDGWWRLAAAGMHDVVPLLAVGGWLLLGPRGALRWTTALLALLWPLGWILLVLAQGELTGFYPYPFVDADRFGYATVTGNCLAVLGLLAAASGGLALVERMYAGSGR